MTEIVAHRSVMIAGKEVGKWKNRSPSYHRFPRSYFEILQFQENFERQTSIFTLMNPV